MCHTKTETVAVQQVLSDNKIYVMLLHVNAYDPYTKIIGAATTKEQANKIIYDYDKMPEDEFEVVETNLIC